MTLETATANIRRRVVITGVGAVTALGLSAESIWKACLAGCSGVTPITSFEPAGFTTRFAAEIKDWDPAPFFASRKEARRVDRFAQFAVAAARMALGDAGLEITDANRDRV